MEQNRISEYISCSKDIFCFVKFCSTYVCVCASVGEGNSTPLQYSCLENPMDGGPWWATVHGVAKSQTRLSDITFTFHFHHWGRNGNPLQCSCLENPRDGGAWWASIYGVVQSRTRLKQLSSSSSSRTPVLFWIKVMRVVIPVLFLTLEEKVSAFHC